MRCDSSRAVLQNNAAIVNLNIYSNYCFFARKSADAHMTGWSTVYPYFQAWKNAGVWTCIQRSMYQQARRQAVLGGMLLVTTLPAPTTQPSPILTPGKIIARAATQALRPISIGAWTSGNSRFANHARRRRGRRLAK
jgi:transposase